MPPVTKLNGFKYWQIGNRYQRAIIVNGKQLYADDYPVSLADIPTEPGDAEFIEMMNKQEAKQ